MKASKFLLFSAFFVATFCTEGVAQTTSTKPKITAKSVSRHVSTPSKRPVAAPTKTARIRFETAFLDLGTIKEDVVIEKSFEFTNVGERDLVIIDTKGSCGCTIPTAPTEPIPPGGKGKIMVKYTAKNKVGPQKPVVTVTTNGVPSIIKLNMEAWVEQIPGGVN